MTSPFITVSLVQEFSYLKLTWFPLKILRGPARENVLCITSIVKLSCYHNTQMPYI